MPDLIERLVEQGYDDVLTFDDYVAVTQFLGHAYNAATASCRLNENTLELLKPFKKAAAQVAKDYFILYGDFSWDEKIPPLRGE